MCFPSVKSSSPYDFLLNDPVQFIKQGAVIAGVALGAGAITSIALKALGYTGAALAVTRVLTGIGIAVGGGMLVLGAGSLAVLGCIFFSVVLRR